MMAQRAHVEASSVDRPATREVLVESVAVRMTAVLAEACVGLAGAGAMVRARAVAGDDEVWVWVACQAACLVVCMVATTGLDSEAKVVVKREEVLLETGEEAATAREMAAAAMAGWGEADG